MFDHPFDRCRRAVRFRPRSIAACIAFALLAGCEAPRTDSAAAPAEAEVIAADAPLPADLAAFRARLLAADEIGWRRIDFAYLQMKAALGNLVVRDIEYQTYVDQLKSADPDLRANGMCGVAASKSPAAIDHLARSLRSEPDPYNRTIAVWCLRCQPGADRIGRVLLEFLQTCPDVDLGRVLAADGTVRAFRSPFPAAAFEAFKGLVTLRGKRDMLEGDGWRAFVKRVNTHIDPQPLTAIDLERLRSPRNTPRTDPDANVRRWIEEMREERKP